MLKKFMTEFLRLKIIAKISLESASNVRRMLRLAHALRAVGISARTLSLVLMVDRLLRDARLSLAFLRCYRSSRARGLEETSAAWRGIRRAIRRHHEYGSRSNFWSGPAGITAADMVASLDKTVLMGLAESLTAGNCIDTDCAIAALSAWPGAGAYHAYDTLRTLRAVMGLRLRGERHAASSMSSNVSMLTRLITLPEVLALARPHCRSSDRGLHAGDAVLVLCETKKALVAMGLLKGGAVYSDRHLVSVIAGPRATCLLFALQSLDPLPPGVLQGGDLQRHAERAQLDECFPATKAAWDRSPHFAVGSEHLASRVMPALRRRGWKPCASSNRGHFVVGHAQPRHGRVNFTM